MVVSTSKYCYFLNSWLESSFQSKSLKSTIFTSSFFRNISHLTGPVQWHESNFFPDQIQLYNTYNRGVHSKCLCYPSIARQTATTAEPIHAGTMSLARLAQARTSWGIPSYHREMRMCIIRKRTISKKVYFSFW